MCLRCLSRLVCSWIVRVLMSDFVWRFVSVVAVSVLAVAVPLAVGSVALLVAGLLLGGAVVLAVSQIGGE